MMIAKDDRPHRGLTRGSCHSSSDPDGTPVGKLDDYEGHRAVRKLAPATQLARGRA